VTTVVREAAVAAPVVRKGSLTAQQHAQRVGERAEAELKRAELALARTLAQTHVARRGLAPEIIAARAWLSHPQSARQAVIASVILGPPVGMDSGMTALNYHQGGPH
jgi:hypothetical protein